ncbi:MAG TPA: 5-formyltetrahydrofolate cyclo-ligase [Hypericibacter adhaerens]|jgi:5,10-methenyltetrahydrofolate synthetase|uniref:5-formyltetrahydrofolate cyclo-ligase n=1 Tax=Hypericibacter adhaerens TaxID=2602016 RepID=A0A5J6MW11_9PROT|nr:5-formyltetrahydrofolate cyclo-ligase [Hypericibacter adhaerens]QEX21639.1 5-formyltetrahydrofolate cyclo-ligase [Hypericibacter adhaerens]HWA42225.1 5-formyltetrahydrofolate cyclo-ligase [Hypericibacter adhaerens]
MNQQNPSWDEVRAWRKGERERLIEARVATVQEIRARWTRAIIETLEPILRESRGPISFYWPFRGEPDLRPLMRLLAGEGFTLALPVVIEPKTPLVFRPWRPDSKLELGVWNIPVPVTKEEVEPSLLLAPVVGFTPDNYRLGYGGGYFDRTLAKLGAGHEAIGVGFEMARLASIYPQPHDIKMRQVVTEKGVVGAKRRPGLMAS